MSTDRPESDPRDPGSAVPEPAKRLMGDVLDPTSLDKIRLMEQGRRLHSGAPSAVSTLIAMFLEDASIQVRAIRDALEAADGKRLHREAHSLRGSCSSLGAVSMASLIGDLERNAEAGLSAEASAILPRLEIALERTRVALEQYRATLK